MCHNSNSNLDEYPIGVSPSGNRKQFLLWELEMLLGQTLIIVTPKRNIDVSDRNCYLNLNYERLG